MKFRKSFIFGGTTKHVVLIPTITIARFRLLQWHQIEVNFRLLNLYFYIGFEVTFELKKGGKNVKIKG